MPNRKKVLVVDDSEVVLDTVEMVLGGVGYVVVTRPEAIGSCALLLRERPDLVLVDISMPLLNGTELVELIRNNDQLRHTSVLLYSDRPDEVLRDLAVRCRANGFVRKSSDFSPLLHAVNNLIGQPI